MIPSAKNMERYIQAIFDCVYATALATTVEMDALKAKLAYYKSTDNTQVTKERPMTSPKIHSNKDNDRSFPSFPAIPNRRTLITITEKIDGITGLVNIREVPLTDGPLNILANDGSRIIEKISSSGKKRYRVRAGDHSRWLQPIAGRDVHEFALWVWNNGVSLLADLGVGDHRGTFWGHSIGRGYGLQEGDRRFSLFNVERWGGYGEKSIVVPPKFATQGLSHVPVIHSNTNNTEQSIQFALDQLRVSGSFAVRGYRRPEGILIFEHASERLSKILFKKEFLSAFIPRKLTTAPTTGTIGGLLSGEWTLS